MDTEPKAEVKKVGNCQRKRWAEKDRANKVRADAHWDVRLAEVAAKLIAGGFTYKDIGVVLGVSESTVLGWTQKYESFVEAAKVGHEAANALTLGQMLRSAWGYDFTETDEKFIEIRDEAGESTGKTKVITVVKTRHQPPNAELLKFIALNRMSGEFKDTKRIEIDENRRIQITGLDEVKALDSFIEKFIESTKQTKQIETKVIDAEFSVTEQPIPVAPSSSEGNPGEPGVQKEPAQLAS